METISSVPAAAKAKLEFAYSGEGKRIKKSVYHWNSQINDYQLASERRFIYDGWNVIAEMDATNTVERSYLWGQDLSGTLQDAGGVGGLLAITITGTNVGTYLTTTDANGNVLGLVDSQGAVAATYEYGPFGEPARVSGSMASQNPFRFSTKYTDDESELVYYGYRYYNPNMGRWINRDLIGERGGVHLYMYVYNSPANRIDPLGLYGEGPGIPITTGGNGLLGPDDIGFGNIYSNFQIVQRLIDPTGMTEVEKALVVIINWTSGQHTFIRYSKTNQGWGIRGGKAGALPDSDETDSKLKEETKTIPLKKTCSKLQYGTGAGKSGRQASNSEICDCLANAPMTKDYSQDPWNWYVCSTWAYEAARSCGLAP